jgi:uncharacterized protein DUF6152
MKGPVRIAGLVVLALGASAGRLSAHHSVGAYYDTTRQLILKGAVTEIEWTNPHMFLHMDVRDDAGTVTRWAIETDSPNALSRAGWVRSTVKPGDEVTATGYPSKKGMTALRLVTLVLADGRKLKG